MTTTTGQRDVFTVHDTEDNLNDLWINVPGNY